MPPISLHIGKGTEGTVTQQRSEFCVYARTTVNGITQDSPRINCQAKRDAQHASLFHPLPTYQEILSGSEEYPTHPFRLAMVSTSSGESSKSNSLVFSSIRWGVTDLGRGR